MPSDKVFQDPGWIGRCCGSLTPRWTGRRWKTRRRRHTRPHARPRRRQTPSHWRWRQHRIWDILQSRKFRSIGLESVSIEELDIYLQDLCIPNTHAVVILVVCPGKPPLDLLEKASAMIPPLFYGKSAPATVSLIPSFFVGCHSSGSTRPYNKATGAALLERPGESHPAVDGSLRN